MCDGTKTSSTITRLDPVPRRPSTSQLWMISTSSNGMSAMTSVASSPAVRSSSSAKPNVRYVAESQPET